MSEFKIKVPGSIKLDQEETRAFGVFLQRVTNRRVLGSMRYGKIQASQLYLSRLGEELKAYKKTGNQEQLLNIAVYAFLEQYAPENKRAHFDNTVDSVTRKRYGGATT
jgi:hypothetical protein